MKVCRWWAIAIGVLFTIMTSACGIKSEDAKLERKEQTVDVYVSDDQLTTLKSYKKKIQFANDDEKYKAAVKTLQSPVHDKDIPLWKGIEFKSLKMDKGTLNIDIHISANVHLGAGGERLALAALEKMLFQFKEVKAIDIRVDGKRVESLMGHVTLEHPIKRP